MARGRFISKSISLDGKVNALSDDTARLLFTWLIAHLDCEGRMYGEATIIKGIVFPRNKISARKIAKYLNEIEKLGLILRYSVNNNNENLYLLAPNFEKHQMGLQKNKEAQSQIPPPPPELLQSCAREDPGQVEVEVEDKDKDKVQEEEEGSAPSFIAYKEKMEKAYPELDINVEWERCQIWYRDHNKEIKSPSLALGNWARKERGFQEGGKQGEQQSEITQKPRQKRRRPITYIDGSKPGAPENEESVP